MSMTLYLRNGGPAGAMPRVPSQPKSPGTRSAISFMVCRVTTRLTATYRCESRSTIVGSALITDIRQRRAKLVHALATAPHRPGHLPLGITFGQVLTLVVGALAARQPDLDLGPPVGVVEQAAAWDQPVVQHAEVPR